MTDITQEPTANPASATNAAAGMGSEYKFGFHEQEKHAFRTKKGLSREVVEQISEQKSEPKWMRDFRFEVPRHLPQETDAELGRRLERDRLR